MSHLSAEEIHVQDRIRNEHDQDGKTGAEKSYEKVQLQIAENVASAKVPRACSLEFGSIQRIIGINNCQSCTILVTIQVKDIARNTY